MRPASEDVLEEICHPQLLFAQGIRRVTKLVLFPVRFMFTAATGRVGTNEAAVVWYLARWNSVGAELVAAALGWRELLPGDDRTAVELLRVHLAALYEGYIDDHIDRLRGVGENELVRDFERWRDRLVRERALVEAAERKQQVR